MLSSSRRLSEHLMFFTQVQASDIDPASMDPDRISLELEVGPSVLCVYSSLIVNFLNIKVCLLLLFVIKDKNMNMF